MPWREVGVGPWEAHSGLSPTLRASQEVGTEQSHTDRTSFPFQWVEKDPLGEGRAEGRERQGRRMKGRKEDRGRGGEGKGGKW